MPEIIMPLITGLFLVCAGVLVGYFLWYRDHSGDDSLREQLQAENQKLHKSIEEHSSQNRVFEQQHSVQDAKLHTLQEMLNQLNASRDQLQREHAELAAQAELHLKQWNELKPLYEREQQKNAELQSQRDALVEREKLQSDEITAQWKHQVDVLETELAARNSDIRHLSSQDQERVGQLKAANELTVQLKSQLNEVQNAYHELAQSPPKPESWTVQVENREATIRQLHEQLEQQGATFTRQLQTVQADVQRHQQTIVELQSELQTRVCDGQALQTINEELNCQIRYAKQQSLKWKELANQREHDLLEKTSEHTKLSEQTLQLIADRQTMLATMDHREKSTADQLAKIKSELERLQGFRQDDQYRVSALTAERNQLKAELDSLEETQCERVELLRLQQTEIQTRLQLTLQQRDQAFDEVQQVRTELDELQKAVQLQQEAHESDDVDSTDSADILAFPNVANDSVYGGQTRVDDQRGRIYIVPPTHRDDLTRITGVTELLERRLNALGVFTYEQIMQWDEPTIAEFSTLLGFTDRIHQDHWVHQSSEWFQQFRRHAA